MKAFHLFIAVLFFTSVLISCKNDSAASTVKEKDKDHLEELEKSINSLKDGNGEVVEIAVLKDALPEKLMGMKRTSHNGQRTGFAGIKISNAEARYEDGDQKMSITITDTGGLGMAFSSLAAWSELEVDNESDDGYERTTNIDGHKAFEKYNRKTKQGELSVISEDRFIYSIKTSNLSEQDMRGVVSKIKIKY